MFVAITIFLLLVTTISLIVLHIAKPDFSYAWPVALTGALLAWISTFLWQLQLPIKLVIYSYTFKDVFNFSFVLVADGYNFPYAIGLTTLALAVILTSVLYATTINSISWAKILFISILGLLAVLSENPLTLVIAWALIDTAGLLSSLYSVDAPKLSEKTVFLLSVRTVGIGLVLWAGIISSSNDQSYIFSSIPSTASLFLLLGVILRTSTMLIRLPYSKDQALERGYDTTFQLVSTAANLVLLSRLTLRFDNLLTSTLIIIIIAFTGILSTLSWLRSPDEQINQPYWMTGLASFAIAASLQGNPVGSAAWGSSLLFLGGLLFLYTVHKKWLTIILLAGIFIISALPFSLTATGWNGNSSYMWIPLIFLLPSQGLLIGSYARSITHEGVVNLDNQPRWVKVIYPMGFVVLVTTGLILGITGWIGAGQIGAWVPALIAGVISLALGLILIRIPFSSSFDLPFHRRPTTMVDSVIYVFWGLFRSLRRLLELFSMTFEGDGGFLWTILLLVVFISVIRGFIR